MSDDETGKPSFYKAAESTAQRLGIKAEEVLERDLQNSRTNQFPTPECIQPDQIENFRQTGEFPKVSQQHILDCIPCAVLMAAEGYEEPEYEKIIRRRAKELGIKPSDLLKKADARISVSMGCLDPWEFAELQEGRPLDEDRMSHLEGCINCKTIRNANKNP
jgi:hypothetical protein